MRHSKHIKGPIEKRFWAKVDKTGDCWNWTGAKTPKGYGKINGGDGSTPLTSRVAWMLHYGEYPELNVLHKCDNPACVRIDHLFLGTLAENNLDMRNKGRKWSKLKPEQVIEIKRRCLSKAEKHADIAKEYGVSKVLIAKISCGDAWPHISLT